MKKFAVLLLAISLLVLAGCSCKHEWQEADCLNPKTCTLCDKTEGEALGHNWEKATCTAPKTCEDCGETEGEPLPHSWLDATCTAPKTCSACKTTEGEALGHSWEEATYEAPKTCSVCVISEGDPLVRTDLGMATEEMVTNMDVAMQIFGYKLTYWGLDEDGWPTYELVESASGNYTKVYVSFGVHPDTSKVYYVFVAAEDVNDTAAVNLMGILAGVGIAVVEEDFDTDKMTQAFAGEPVIQDNVAYYWVEDHGLVAEMQVDSQYAAFWIYPAE